MPAIIHIPLDHKDKDPVIKSVNRCLKDRMASDIGGGGGGGVGGGGGGGGGWRSTLGISRLYDTKSEKIAPLPNTLVLIFR